MSRMGNDMVEGGFARFSGSKMELGSWPPPK